MDQKFCKNVFCLFVNLMNSIVLCIKYATDGLSSHKNCDPQEMAHFSASGHQIKCTKLKTCSTFVHKELQN